MAMDGRFSDCVTRCAGSCRQLPGAVTKLVLSFLKVATHRVAAHPCSIVDFCQPHPSPAVESIAPLRLWDLLFLGCRSIGAELLERKAAGGRHWLTHAELLELGPRTLVGLPALVLLRMALRGACAEWRHRRREAVLLCSGQWLTRQNLPADFVGQEALSWMLEAQDSLKAARVGHSDFPVLEGLALWEGDLQGTSVLVLGEDVEVTEDVITSSFMVRAGSSGVIKELSKDKKKALVQFDDGPTLLVEAAKLQKLGGDRPKPLEASPPPEADQKMAAMQAAVGRIRSTAVSLTSKPTYVKFFQSMVLTPLEHGRHPEPQQADAQRTGGRRAKCASGRRATSAC